MGGRGGEERKIGDERKIGEQDNRKRGKENWRIKQFKEKNGELENRKLGGE